MFALGRPESGRVKAKGLCALVCPVHAVLCELHEQSAASSLEKFARVLSLACTLQVGAHIIADAGYVWGGGSFSSRIFPPTPDFALFVYHAETMSVFCRAWLCMGAWLRCGVSLVLAVYA